jgi:hypothetical protein
VTSYVLGPQLTTVGDPGEGMSSKLAPTHNLNPCYAKDCGELKNVESSKNIESLKYLHTKGKKRKQKTSAGRSKEAVIGSEHPLIPGTVAGAVGLP